MAGTAAAAAASAAAASASASAALLRQPAVASSSRRPRALLGQLLRRRGLASDSSSSNASDGGVQVTSRQARRQQWLKEKEARAAAAEAAGPAPAAAAGATATAEAAAAAPGGGVSTALKALGGAAVVGGGYLVYKAAASDSTMDKTMRDTPVVGAAYGWVYDTVLKPFIDPSREKLLPDWHSIPNIPPDAPCPPTLVLDLEDTLVHATWDPKYGWRYAKRPGVDRFLQDLSKYYEIVLFSPSNFGVVDPITWTLDKEGLIMHRLYRDATRFHQGKHVKDLSKLNRDLRHVVIVDDDPDAFQFQPENGIRIKAFVDPKDKGDRSLDKLRKFLLAVVMEGVADDIPAVLRQFRGLDADALGDAYEQRIRAAKLREAEKHMKGLGGLLRKQKAFQGVANPFAGAAGGEQAPSQPTKGLSAKDIVGGAPQEQQQAGARAAPGELPPELQHKQSAPPPAGPVKKGKLWDAYQNYLKEAEEDQRRKLELWQRKQAQREAEARRAALEQQAAGGR